MKTYTLISSNILRISKRPSDIVKLTKLWKWTIVEKKWSCGAYAKKYDILYYYFISFFIRVTINKLIFKIKFGQLIMEQWGA